MTAKPHHVGPDAPILAVAAGTVPRHTPVWFMRQAGRALPEYRALRRDGSITDAIENPDVATEATLQPVRRYGVDAAILFSDIMTPLQAMGVGVTIEPGVGPVVAQPVRSAADLARIRTYEPDVDAPYVGETVRRLAAELRVPLIGFAGAPFTVASYLVEGRPSRNHAVTKALMRREPSLWLELCDRLADVAIAALTSQVAHGASLVQLFDSWAGALSPTDYERYVLPSSAKVMAAVGELRVPRIHFGVGTAELLGPMASAGVEVMGVDWRTPLDVARARIAAHVGHEVPVQGNLDPTAVLAGWDVARRATLEVLATNGSHPGHIFNLGHGVLPETDPGVLADVVALVHEQTAR